MTEPNDQKPAKIIQDLRRLADALEAMQGELTNLDDGDNYSRTDIVDSLCRLSIDLLPILRRQETSSVGSASRIVKKRRQSGRNSLLLKVN